MTHYDTVVAGAGIIGCALALELERRGARVLLLDAGTALLRTSHAAAGMLAVEDPLNPAALHPLSALSAALYPAWLDRIAELGGERVAFQTTTTLEACAQDDPARLADARALVPQIVQNGLAFRLLEERSVDPRQLGRSLRAALDRSRVTLREDTPLKRVTMQPSGVVCGADSEDIAADTLVDAMGTWSPAPVSPRKGQMLAVAAPKGFDLGTVVRSEGVYIVPRTSGLDAGRLVIGATIEDTGFDLEVHARDILTLNAAACDLLPVLRDAVFLESWAGLRPVVRDGLPLLGPARGQTRYVLATGHFRNGILLAPATAQVLAQQLAGEATSIDLTPFSPDRFSFSARR